MEEVVVAVFGGDKPESALGDELLDGSRHIVDLLSRTYCLALSRPVRAGPGERTHFECCHTFTQRQPGPNLKPLPGIYPPPLAGEGRVGATAPPQTITGN